MNFLERCLPELGIANSSPNNYLIVPHRYTHAFGLLPNVSTSVDNKKAQSEAIRAYPKNPFFKGLNASPNFG